MTVWSVFLLLSFSVLVVLHMLSPAILRISDRISMPFFLMIVSCWMFVCLTLLLLLVLILRLVLLFVIARMVRLLRMILLLRRLAAVLCLLRLSRSVPWVLQGWRFCGILSPMLESHFCLSIFTLVFRRWQCFCRRVIPRCLLRVWSWSAKPLFSSWNTQSCFVLVGPAQEAADYVRVWGSTMQLMAVSDCICRV